jgi:hypothetical protein
MEFFRTFIALILMLVTVRGSVQAEPQCVSTFPISHFLLSLKHFEQLRFLIGVLIY